MLRNLKSWTKVILHTYKMSPYGAVTRKKSTGLRVCVVGSGPAGFYTAQQLIKVNRIKVNTYASDNLFRKQFFFSRNEFSQRVQASQAVAGIFRRLNLNVRAGLSEGHSDITVDICDKSPVPFGLVRYGVAPDHPEVKNVINTFTNVAENARVNFLGNVCVGRDVNLEELREAYHAIVLSYGAERDQKLGIPGEELPNILPARRFVGWYNGLPADAALEVNLQTETAAVIGHGNVALDVARILLTPIDILKKTDITAHALEALAGSKVKRVVLIGRRGPLQVAFTIKELREMTKLPQCDSELQAEDFFGISEVVKDLARPRKRLTALMLKTVTERTSPVPDNKAWQLKFLRSPLEFQQTPDGSLSGILLGVNRLVGPPGEQQQRAEATSQTEFLPCGLVLRSIGYRSMSIDDLLPFDNKKGVILNEKGRVTGCEGLYCSGWVSRGPVGVILATMTDGFDVGKCVLQDIQEGRINISGKRSGIGAILKQRGVQVVSFDDWKKIEKIELEQGKTKGKLAEKVISVEEMIKIAKGS